MNHQPTPKFTVLPKNSVGLYAEGTGHPNLHDDVLASLSEDITYRLRETINNALRFMRHGKRRYMTTEDFNHALKWSNCQAIHGQGGVDVPNFRSFHYKDSTMSYTEDRDANLRETAFDLMLPTDPGEVSIKAQWLVFEGHSCSGGKQTKDETVNREVLEEPFASFLEKIISSVFGRNQNARKVALDNIRVSGKLQSVLPYLVTFLASQVKSCNGSDSLKEIIQGVLLIVHALVDNTLLFMLPYVLQLVKLLLFIITDENLPVEFWDCKLQAVRILTQLCRRHMSTMNYLPHHLLKAYQETLNDDTKPLGSIFGAAFGIACLGSEPAHQIVYPILLKRIDSIKKTVSCSKDISVVKGSLLVYELFQSISLFLLRTASSSQPSATGVKNSRSSAGNAPPSSAFAPSHKYFSIYNELQDYFEDGIATNVQCPNATSMNGRSIFNPCKAVSSKQNNSRPNYGFALQTGSFFKADGPTFEVDKAKAASLPNPKQSPSNVLVPKEPVQSSLQTSLGIINSEFKWYKQNLQAVNIFDDEDSDSDGQRKTKRRRVSASKHHSPQNVNIKGKEKIEKLVRRFNRVTRLRLTDLAKIPTTTNILI